MQRDRSQIDQETPAPIADFEANTIKRPMQALLKSLGLEQTSIQHRLMQSWDKMAGHPLNRHVRPGPVANGQLTVYVSNSTMMAELSRFQGPALLKNIRDTLGTEEIKKLRFQIDPDTRPAR